MSIRRKIARALANSFFFSGARALAAKNRADWNLSLGRIGNLWVSSYLILVDYGAGLLPRARSSRESVHQSERQYGHDLGGVSRAEFLAREMRKPFWDSAAADKYLHGFVRLWRVFESLGVLPPARLLELGCGSGWMAECFALAGYEVMATTLSASDLAAVEKRAASLRAKGVSNELTSKLGPMESIDQVVPAESFDAAYVHQALHHAHDWEAALLAVFRTLRPGGWLVLADEPNVFHTVIGYRMAKMSGTREVGMSQRKIVRCLRQAGYREIRILSPKLNDRLHPHWIVAQKK